MVRHMWPFVRGARAPVVSAFSETDSLSAGPPDLAACVTLYFPMPPQVTTHRFAGFDQQFMFVGLKGPQGLTLFPLS